MSSLYLLGSGTTFRSCRAVCKISTSEIRKFFFLFLDAFYDMRDEYIQLPADMATLSKVSACYKSVGLPGACSSMDVVHVKWSKCPAGDFIEPRGRRATQLWLFNASLTTTGSLACMVPSFDQIMTSTS
jgi:hypothetical protein